MVAVEREGLGSLGDDGGESEGAGVRWGSISSAATAARGGARGGYMRRTEGRGGRMRGEGGAGGTWLCFW